MWDLFSTVRHRHSVRKYQTDMPIEEEKLHAILETACAAPSAGDLQAYHIYVVKQAEQRNAIAEASQQQEFIKEAPISLVFCSDPARSANEFKDRGEQLYALQDTTIAAAYAQLAAVAAGLGSTWVGNFDEQRLMGAIDIKPGLTPVAILTIGYPAELPELSSRRNIKEVVTHC